VKVETVVLDERSTMQEVQKAIERRSRRLVIASLYGACVRDRRRVSAYLNRRARVVGVDSSEGADRGISFGNPYLLQAFPGLRTYVVRTATCRVAASGRTRSVG
jgi:hypothetical protein